MQRERFKYRAKLEGIQWKILVTDKTRQKEKWKVIDFACDGREAKKIVAYYQQEWNVMQCVW